MMLLFCSLASRGSSLTLRPGSGGGPGSGVLRQDPSRRCCGVLRRPSGQPPAGGVACGGRCSARRFWSPRRFFSCSLRCSCCWASLRFPGVRDDTAAGAPPSPEPLAVERRVKAATERLSTNMLSTKCLASSWTEPNLRDSSFSAHSRIRCQAAWLASSSSVPSLGCSLFIMSSLANSRSGSLGDFISHFFRSPL
uniref:Uncharacterized protein n=1 Tax=Ixodes ricinus TaxID=34613 RepID=A0A6B0V1P9_IXORI